MMKRNHGKLFLTVAQKAVWQELIENGAIDIKETARKLLVSRQTVYNALNVFENFRITQGKGKAAITIGKKAGTSQPWSPYMEQIKTVAEYLFEQLPMSHRTIFLDGGLIPYYIAELIYEKESLVRHVATFNPLIANHFSVNGFSPSLFFISGHYNKNTMACSGLFLKTHSQIWQDYTFDYAFLTADSICIRGEEMFLNAEYDEMEQKNFIFKNSNKVIIVVEKPGINGGGYTWLKYGEESIAPDNVTIVVHGADELAEKDLRKILGDNLCIVNY